MAIYATSVYSFAILVGEKSKLKTKIFVTATAGTYQHYAPLFVYCMNKAYPEYEIIVGCEGYLDKMTLKAIAQLKNRKGVLFVENFFDGIPLKESTANLLRFLYEPKDPCALFTTDIDMLYFDIEIDVIQWHQSMANEMDAPYYTHHGATKHPNRFPGKSWHGEYERLLGGAAWFSPEWYDRTRSSRYKYLGLANTGAVGIYREEDEVILCRICKEAGLWINPNKIYPAKFRGLHLGDFRNDMEHRWKNREKMVDKLTDDNCMRFLDMHTSDETWGKLMEIVGEDPVIAEVFGNVKIHLEERLKGVSL